MVACVAANCRINSRQRCRFIDKIPSGAGFNVQPHEIVDGIAAINVDSLTRVRPLMGFEVRALGVHLLAAEKLAFVYPALRVGRTVLVAPRVVSIGHVVRGCGCARVRVLRAGDRGEAVRCDGDHSAKKQKRETIFFLSLAAISLITISLVARCRGATDVPGERARFVRACYDPLL